MKRRDLLQGIAALSTSPVLSSLLPGFAGAQDFHPARLIDAHCHIFNADDLPIIGFVERVVLPRRDELKDYETQYGNAIRFFVRKLADWMRDNAFTAEDEVIRLDAIAAGTQRVRTRDEIESADIDELADLIQELMGLRINGGNFTFREKVISSYLPGVLIGFMHREAYPDRYKHKGLDNIDGEFDVWNWENPKTLANDLYRNGRGMISLYMRWALLFTRFRYELADELSRIHGGRLKLITPALIDYSNWLNDPYDVRLASQVKAMGRIARRKGSARVHCYAPFDPLREVVFRASSGSGESPLALVKRAVAEEGFVGVKLYPPMGFMPFNNAKLSAGDFPDFLKRDLRRVAGVKLDEVFTDLYTWCVAQQVPVIAHAANSNGAGEGYSGRASPDNWAAVATKFKGIRLCLAHFGDFDAGFATRQNPRPRIEDTWEWKMAALSRASTESQVFIDISYFDFGLLSDDDARRKEVVRMLNTLRTNFPEVANRLVFGTDWTMFGKEEKFGAYGRNGKYADRIADLLDAAKFDRPAITRIMFENAGSFLGLDLPATVDGNRKRLTDFYRAHAPTEAGWLNDFPVRSS